jgi:hypothetical protein
MIFLTETPRFLVKAHSEEKALETLAYLRDLPADHPYIVEEFSAILHYIELEKQEASTYSKMRIIRDSFGPRIRGRLLIGQSNVS